MKNTKKILALILCVVMVIGLTACGGSSETAQATEKKSQLDEILERGYLIVGTGSGNVPWHFIDDNGEYAGFDIEIAKMLARALFNDETKLEIVEQASDARLANVLSHKVDISLQFMTITPQRCQQCAMTLPYYTEGVGVILSAKNATYKSYEDLKAAVAAGKEVKLGVLQNATAADLVQQALEGATDLQFEEQALVYQAVQSGQVDAGVVDLSSIKWLASQQPDVYTDAGYAFSPQNYGGAMDPKETEWIYFVNSVLIDLQTGKSYQQYNEAFAKYFGDSLPAPEVGKTTMFK